MLESDARKAIQFVVAFLPGFVSLALADAVVGLPFSQFEFIYVAILLSVLIYFLADQVSGVLRRRTLEEKSPWPTVAFVAVSFLLTLPFSYFVSTAVKNDYLPRSVNWAFGNANSFIGEKEFQKLSRDDVFGFVLKHRQDCTLFRVSPRSPHWLHGVKRKLPEAHKPWAVVRGEHDEIYEGNVRFFSGGRGDVKSVYLAPACKIASERGDARLDAVQGNGVFLSGVSRLEFIDVESSGCAKLFDIAPYSCLETDDQQDQLEEPVTSNE